jgi:hypothetical protein
MGYGARLVPAALVALALAVGAVPAHAAGPALFQVGAGRATTDPDPTVPVYSGGFGPSPPITKVHDPLSARAIYVSNGKHAVAFAVVDAQGYFAAYQDGPGVGISADRADAAKAITALGGPAMSPGDIVVQATHGHAAPTLEGIWGPTPKAYLDKVHRAIVAALGEAARSARPAFLQTATIDASRLDTATMDTDSYPGWSNDGTLHVLRALDPKSGATIATFANVSVHGAQVQGDKEKFFSSDYFGMSEARVERALGGAAIVGPATLGREESPVEVTDVPTAEWFSGIVTGLITRALADAQWVTDPTVAGTQSFVQFPATNLALLALVEANHASADQKQQAIEATGDYPIDRADTPPYQTGNVLGTWLTALRIGPLAYVSMPGEPFPEIAHALRLHVAGAKTVTLLSKGQDDFGYFYPPWVYPFVFAYGDDHHIFNVAPQAGDDFIRGQLGNLAALGFQTSAYVLPAPMQTEYTRTLSPGLETLASPPEGDAGPDGLFHPVLTAIYSPPTFSQEPSAHPVHWDFGDGTKADTGYLMTGQNYGHQFPTHVEDAKEGRFTHGFRPGAYTTVATAADPEGRDAVWKLPVRAYPRLCPAALVRRSRHGLRFVGSASGGQGTVLAWRWAFSDGASAAGRAVVHRVTARRARATLVVTDATGTTAPVDVPARAGGHVDACSGVLGVRRVHRHHRSRGYRRPAPGAGAVVRAQVASPITQP